MTYVLIGLGIAGGLLGLHLLATWMEGRGWIYYREKRRSGGTLTNAALQVQSLVDPSAEHLLQERLREDAEVQESGEPPEPGSARAGQEPQSPRR